MRAVSCRVITFFVARGFVPFPRMECRDSDCLEFPGAGYRNETNGALTNVGQRGYYWSSSPNAGGSANSAYLNFINDGTLTWALNGNRAAGLGVRCVSALTTVIAYIWFPGAGDHRHDNGGLENVGTNSYYWSSSPFSAGSANAGRMNFNSSGSYPVNENYRVNGFSVRCVSELMRKKVLPSLSTERRSTFFIN